MKVALSLLCSPLMFQGFCNCTNTYLCSIVAMDTDSNAFAGIQHCSVVCWALLNKHVKKIAVI